MQLRPGDGLLLKGFTDNPSPNLSLSYKGPGKGLYHISLYLGVYGPDHEKPAYRMDVDERLNHLGWVFDPIRARAIIEEKEVVSQSVVAT